MRRSIHGRAPWTTTRSIPQAAQQREIVDGAVKPGIVDRFPADLDDEGPPAVGADVGRGTAEPLDEAHRAACRAGIAHRAFTYVRRIGEL